MEGKKPLQIALIVVALAAAGFFVWRNAGALSTENPDTTTRKIWFLCQNESCKNEFQVAASESRAYAAAHDGDPVPCPKCGGAKVSGAFQCPSCQKIMLPGGHSSPPKKCPFCKVALPADLE